METAPVEAPIEVEVQEKVVVDTITVAAPDAQ